MPNFQGRPQTNLFGCHPQKPAFKVLRSALWSQLSVTSSLVGQGNGNRSNSIAYRNPKIPNSPSLTLKKASCNDRFPTADDSLLPQLQRESAMNQLLGTRGSPHTDRYGSSTPRASLSPWVWSGAPFSHRFFHWEPGSYFETLFSSHGEWHKVNTFMLLAVH